MLFSTNRIYFVARDFNSEETTLISTHRRCAHELKSFPGGVLFPLNLTLLFIS